MLARAGLSNLRVERSEGWRGVVRGRSVVGLVNGQVVFDIGCVGVCRQRQRSTTETQSSKQSLKGDQRSGTKHALSESQTISEAVFLPFPVSPKARTTSVNAAPTSAHRFQAGMPPPARLRGAPELVGRGEYLREENMSEFVARDKGEVGLGCRGRWRRVLEGDKGFEVEIREFDTVESPLSVSASKFAETAGVRCSDSVSVPACSVSEDSEDDLAVEAAVERNDSVEGEVESWWKGVFIEIERVFWPPF